MSVAYDACRAVAGVVLERGFYLPDDLDQLIGSCHGNGHDEHLSANLARAVGFHAELSRFFHREVSHF